MSFTFEKLDGGDGVDTLSFASYYITYDGTMAEWESQDITLTLDVGGAVNFENIVGQDSLLEISDVSR